MSRTANKILHIPETRAYDLFPGEEQAVGRAYRRLVMEWHPNRCSDPRAGNVANHLGSLRTAALKRLGAV